MQDLSSTVLQQAVEKRPTLHEIVDCLTWLSEPDDVLSGPKVLGSGLVFGDDVQDIGRTAAEALGPRQVLLALGGGLLGILRSGHLTASLPIRPAAGAAGRTGGASETWARRMACTAGSSLALTPIRRSRRRFDYRSATPRVVRARTDRSLLVYSHPQSR
jgi:hypothetical protein